MQGGGQRHHGVKTHVILPAECPGIGESGGGGKAAQFGARPQAGDQQREQLGGRRFLQEADQRFQFTESEGGIRFRGVDRAQVQPGGDFHAHAGDQHAAANFGQEFTTGLGRFHGGFGVVK